MKRVDNLTAAKGVLEEALEMGSELMNDNPEVMTAGLNLGILAALIYIAEALTPAATEVKWPQ